MGVASELHESKQWRVHDYIVDGTYCDNLSIHAQLREVMVESKSSGALLLVWMRETDVKAASEELTFFQSLLLFCHHSADLEKVVQKELMERFPKKKTSLPSPGLGSFDSVFGSLVQHPPFNILKRHVPTKTKVRFMWVHHPRGLGQTTMVGVLLLAPAAENVTTPQSHLARLYTMLHASAPIVVHRNLKLIRATERAIQESVGNDGHPGTGAATPQEEGPLDFKIIARPLLRAAMSMTGSRMGCTYLASSDRRTLYLAASEGIANPKKDIPIHGSSEKKNKRDSESHDTWITSYAFIRRWPLLVQPGHLADIHPAISDRWTRAVDKISESEEIAVPIVQNATNPAEAKVLGVIRVGKGANERSHYTANDLTLLRMIGLHFCLRHSELVAKTTNERLANLSRSQFQPISATLRRALTLVTNPKSKVRGWHPLIPVEYYLARKQILSALHQILDLTSARAATVRFVSRGGFYLVRFCALPESKADTFQLKIKASEPRSVNCWVARTGRECDLPDLSVHKSFDNYAGLLPLERQKHIRSVYCLPITVRGRVVGTLYVESEYPNAFHSHVALLRGMTEQIRLFIIRAQNLSEQEILLVGARAALNTHKLFQYCDELNRLSAGLESSLPEISGELRDVHDKIKVCLHDLTRPARAKRATHEAYRSLFFEVVTEVINERRTIVDFRSDLRGATRRDQWISRATAVAFRLALNEVLDNVKLAIRGSTPTLEIHEAHRGGRDYLRLHIIHRISLAVNDERLRRVYRVPIVDEYRLHLGAFIAGSVLRNIGGDIWMLIEDHDPWHSNVWATTVIDVPRDTTGSPAEVPDE